MSEHSLHKRVAAAAEERRLSANRLTAYQRAWPKILRFARKCAVAALSNVELLPR
jgi:hypothetical protein